MENTNTEVERLQECMLAIRGSMGWTAAEFGEKIGVTRQTINNLEANHPEKFRLSKTQYLAIRKVLDDEIRANPKGTSMLSAILEILVDHPDKYPEEERSNVLEKARIYAPSILGKSAPKEETKMDWLSLLATGVMGAVVAGVGIMLMSGGKKND